VTATADWSEMVVVFRAGTSRAFWNRAQAERQPGVPRTRLCQHHAWYRLSRLAGGSARWRQRRGRDRPAENTVTRAEAADGGRASPTPGVWDTCSTTSPCAYLTDSAIPHRAAGRDQRSEPRARTRPLPRVAQCRSRAACRALAGYRAGAVGCLTGTSRNAANGRARARRGSVRSTISAMKSTSFIRSRGEPPRLADPRRGGRDFWR